MDRVILTTGGTGGHIFPALAVAEEIRRRHPNTRILFIGSSYGMEAELARQAGIEFAGLPVRGVMGRGARAAAAILRMGVGLIQALGLMRKFDPQVVAGFGGYASFAPILGAYILRKPRLLHEQNAIAGTSNRFLGRLSNTVCVSVAGTKGFGPGAVATGNPVRANIPGASAPGRSRSGRRLFVLGGSQGAHALNVFVREMLPVLARSSVQLLHQCGKKDFEELRRAYVENGYPGDCVQPFIHDMRGAYAWADLALCRSGASTIAELCASGTPAVLVPFPAAIHDHQTFNARALAEAGAAILIPEADLAEQGSRDGLLRLLGDCPRLESMSRAALALAQPGAAAKIVDEIEKLAARQD